MSDAYWDGYHDTLRRVREEKPTDLAQLKVILDAFQEPSSGVAFFGNGADDTLDQALTEVGWRIAFIDGDYLWQAMTPSGDLVHFVEGDLYEGPWPEPTA